MTISSRRSSSADAGSRCEAVEQEEEQEPRAEGVSDVDDEPAAEQPGEVAVAQGREAVRQSTRLACHRGLGRCGRIRKEQRRADADHRDEAGEHEVAGDRAELQQHDDADADDDPERLR